MAERARVSVIIPTYNRADMLPAALESVAAQTYRPLQVVVIDDGSTDDTPAVVSRFASSPDFEVRYRRQENSGCAAARNAGIGMATGEYVAFLDSDDAWLPNALASLVEALRSAAADFVYSPSIEVYPSGRERVHLPAAAHRPGDFAVEHFKSGNVRPGALLYRREIVARVGGMDERLHHTEDTDFVQRVALAGNAAYCPVPTVRVRNHAGGKSRNRAAIWEAMRVSAERILAEHPQFAAALGRSADLRIARIRRLHAEALAAAGDFARAREAASRADPGIALRVSLALHASWPLRLAHSSRETRNRILYVLGRA